jgi:hypothetical protein
MSRGALMDQGARLADSGNQHDKVWDDLFPRSAWEHRCRTLCVRVAFPCVVTLADAERRIGRSHAGAWERELMEISVQKSVVASGNTYNPSLIVLRNKGYELWLEKGEDGSLWCAKKGDQSFLAYSGPELLGLVTLWENLGEDWNQQQPDVYSELIDQIED